MRSYVARLRARPGVDPDRLQQAAAEALNPYFHPITGGPEGGGWPFGRPILAGEVQVIQGGLRIAPHLLRPWMREKHRQLLTDLADAEKAEIKVLLAYLPARMGDAELAQAVSAAIAESGASGVKDMGKVMALLKPRLAGKADMGKVSALVKTKLAG